MRRDDAQQGFGRGDVRCDQSIKREMAALAAE
jgi:hypothetical protein